MPRTVEFSGGGAFQLQGRHPGLPLFAPVMSTVVGIVKDGLVVE